MIVIKSLVPGGVAQVDGRLLPGDRLIFVNDEMLENASLDEAVNALKGAPKGIVRIGVKKALPLGGIEAHQQAELQVNWISFSFVWNAVSIYVHFAMIAWKELINTSFDLFSDDHLVWALSYVQMKSVHISWIRLFKKLNILDF